MTSRAESCDQKKRFMEDLASRCGFSGKKWDVFLYRFGEEKHGSTNETIAESLWTDEEVADRKQTFQDHLTRICDRLVEKGSPGISSKKRSPGRPKVEESPWQNAYRWLWDVKFPEWQEQISQTSAVEITKDNWQQVCQEVRSRCRTKILITHNHIQLYTLKQIDLDWLFVPVFVRQEPSSQLESRQNNPPPEPALEIVERYQYLMILGKPGAGKSTFATYLATTCCGEESETDWIPVLLRLNEVDTRTSFRLLDALGTAFGTEIDITQQILKSGKVFLILDGLDEVSSQFRQDICQEISNFVLSPYTNKVVITCRTDLKDYKLSSFEHVEIADFDKEQQNQFIANWFTIGGKDAKSWLAIRLQQHPECTSQMLINQVQQNERLQELAKTPILLSLICLVYVSDGNLPEKRSSLYEKGLEILLEDWDRDRCIENRVESATYQSLSSDDKRKILAELARYTFDQAEDTVAFEQATALEIIAQYRNYSPQESLEILEGIAADHGLVFRAARRKWEFSHLTFQEYFVARWFCDHCDWQTLANHAIDERWREVFLLIIESVEDANTFIESIHEKALYIQLENIKIDEIVSWTYKKSRLASLEIEHCLKMGFKVFDAVTSKNSSVTIEVAKKSSSTSLNIDCRSPELRGFYFDLFNRYIISNTHSLSSMVIDHLYLYMRLNTSSEKIIPQILILDHLLYWLNNCIPSAMPFLLGTSFDHFGQALMKLSETLTTLSKLGIFIVEIHESLLNFRNKMLILSNRISYHQSNDDMFGEACKLWNSWLDDEVNENFIKELKYTVSDQRDFVHEWLISDKEKESVRQYYEVNKLLVDCLGIAKQVNNITLEITKKITESLLLPIAEIEKRRKIE